MKIFHQEAFAEEQLNSKNQTIASTLEEAMSFVKPIPDQLVLTHELLFKDECCITQEESIFSQIPGIGDLHLGGLIDNSCKQCTSCKSGRCKMCKLQCVKCTCVCNCCYCCCNYEFTHYYPGPLYTLENDIIKFQHFGKLSKLFVKGQLALEFNISDYNTADLLCGECYSGYPHILFKNPHQISNPAVYFEPGENKCPTEPCVCIPGCCVICSFCGISQREKEICVRFLPQNPLYQASCSIITRRTKKIACYQQCGCKKYCNIVNYPTIEIQFQNVNQIDRLGIIMSAIHYSINDYWSRYNWNGKHYFNLPLIYEYETDF